MGLTSGERFAVRMSHFVLNFSELLLYIPLARPHKGLNKKMRIRYGEGRRAALDVSRRTDTKEKLPLFIYIHGGGFLSGKRTSRRFYCYNWAKEGYVTANIGYDYGLDAVHPEHIRQIFKGIEYVLDRAEEYGIDTDRIVVAGESAGGYFAALVAAVASHRALYGELGIDFAYKDDFKVSACVLLSGLYDPVRSTGTGFPLIGLDVKTFLGKSEAEMKDGIKEGDAPCVIDDYADAAFPPAFIVASKYDKLATESEDLRDELVAAGAEHEFFLCTGINGVHAGALACELAASGRECLRRAQDFVARALAEGANKCTETGKTTGPNEPVEAAPVAECAADAESAENN